MEKTEKHGSIVTQGGWTTPDKAEAIQQIGDTLGVEVEIVPEGEQYTLDQNTGIVPKGQSMVKYKVESGDAHRIFSAKVANELRKPKSKQSLKSP